MSIHSEFPKTCDFWKKEHTYLSIKSERNVVGWIDQCYKTEEGSWPFTQYEILSSRITRGEIHIVGVLETINSLQKVRAGIGFASVFGIFCAIEYFKGFPLWQVISSVSLAISTVYFLYWAYFKCISIEKCKQDSRDLTEYVLETDWTTSEFASDFKALMDLLSLNLSDISRLCPGGAESLVQPPLGLRAEVGIKLCNLAREIAEGELVNKSVALHREQLEKYLVVCKRFKLVKPDVNVNQFIGNARKALADEKKTQASAPAKA